MVDQFKKNESKFEAKLDYFDYNSHEFDIIFKIQIIFYVRTFRIMMTLHYCFILNSNNDTV